MAAPDADLPSADDGASWQEVLPPMEGKKVGVPTPIGSALQPVLAASFDEVGVDDVTREHRWPGPAG